MTTYRTNDTMSYDDGAFGDKLEGYYIIDHICAEEAYPEEDTEKMVICELKNNAGVADAYAFGDQLDLTDKDNYTVVYASGVRILSSVNEYELSELRRVTLADEGKYDIRDLLPHAKIFGDEGIEYVKEQLPKYIEDGEYRRLCEAMLEEHGVFLGSSPASLNHGYASVGGLLTHSFELMKMAYAIATYYNQANDYTIDVDLLCAGALLHDIGKAYDFDLRPNMNVVPYARALPLDHVYFGREYIEEIGEKLGMDPQKVEKVGNMAESHHFNGRYGTGMPFMTPEAELLSYLDSAEHFINWHYDNDITFYDGVPSHSSHTFL